MNPIYTVPSYFSKIHLIFFLPPLSYSKGLGFLLFSVKLGYYLWAGRESFSSSHWYRFALLIWVYHISQQNVCYVCFKMKISFLINGLVSAFLKASSLQTFIPRPCALLFDPVHATCHMLHATCHMLHATCYMPHTTCYMPHATCHILHATCSSHLIHFQLNTLAVLCKEHKRWSSSWCSFLQTSLTSPLCSPTFCSAPCS